MLYPQTQPRKPAFAEPLHGGNGLAADSGMLSPRTHAPAGERPMVSVTPPDNSIHLTTAPWPGEDDGDEGRQRRGLVIAATTPYLKVAGGWLTPSQQDSGVMYHLARDEDGVYCSCPDYEQRATICKHGRGLEYHIRREQTAKAFQDGIGQSPAATNGSIPAAVLEKPATAPDPTPVLYKPAPERPVIQRMPETNPAKPPKTSKASTLYNAAQENEYGHFINLLWDLVQIVPQEPRGRGRPQADIQQVLFGLVHRFYNARSARRSYSDLKVAAAVVGLDPEDLTDRVTMTRRLEDKATTPILEHLVEMSAVPVSPIETRFALDSTGFGTTIRDETWADAKWGTPESRQAYTGSTWTKAHFGVGVYTSVIPAAVVTPSLAGSGDAPQFPKLLHAISRHFHVEEVYADKAYSSLRNIKAAVAMGAKVYIPFRENSIYRDPTTEEGMLWNELLGYFHRNLKEFKARYHQRSKVESANSSIKRLFTPITRSKAPAARVNEILARVVGYNITRVIHASYTDGIKPFFGD